jgi:hypothetical protein
MSRRWPPSLTGTDLRESTLTRNGAPAADESVMKKENGDVYACAIPMAGQRVRGNQPHGSLMAADDATINVGLAHGVYLLDRAELARLIPSCGSARAAVVRGRVSDEVDAVPGKLVRCDSNARNRTSGSSPGMTGCACQRVGLHGAAFTRLVAR